MKQTKREKLDDSYVAYRAAKTGVPPQSATKDGSIQTHPTVPVPQQLEAKVLAECLKWLKARRIFCDRHDCAGGNLGHGYARYGIEGAGDIIGILPDGRHLEVECKAGHGGRLSVIQQVRMIEIRATNGVYLVVHGREELAEMMKGLI